MLKFQFKCQELLKILPELQCQDCKDVPGPSEPKKRRYSCMNEAHVLCEDHKDMCPCGSLVGKKPSQIVAKILEDSPWMCQNYEKGCREIKKDEEELEYHQGKCIFRPVYCPSFVCIKTKVMFKDVSDHLTKFHKIYTNNSGQWKFPMFHYKGFDEFDFEPTAPDQSWRPVKITSTYKDMFFEVSYLKYDAFHTIIYLYGSSDEAKKFSCTISVTNKVNCLERKWDLSLHLGRLF